jgi:hypothetical protein
MTQAHGMSPSTGRLTWRCTQCGSVLSEHFAAPQHIGDKSIVFCRLCGGPCESLADALEKLKQKPAPTMGRAFFIALPGAFVYPFRGQGLILVVVGALFFTFVDFARRIPIANIASAFWAAYLAAFLFKIIVSTTNGEDHLPDWPSAKDFQADIGSPILLTVGAAVVSFLPLILYTILAYFLGFEYPVVAFVLALFGLMYQPMALLSAAIHYSLVGLDPRKILPAIRKTYSGYLAACLLMALIGAVAKAQKELFVFFPIPIVGTVVGGTITFYLSLVEMRILGLLYRCYEKKFTWLDGISTARVP